MVPPLSLSGIPTLPPAWPDSPAAVVARCLDTAPTAPRSAKEGRKGRRQSKKQRRSRSARGRLSRGADAVDADEAVHYGLTIDTHPVPAVSHCAYPSEEEDEVQEDGEEGADARSDVHRAFILSELY